MKQVQEKPVADSARALQGWHSCSRAREKLTDFGRLSKLRMASTVSSRFRHFLVTANQASSEVLKKGQEIDAVITSIDSENRRSRYQLKTWNRTRGRSSRTSITWRCGPRKVARFANFGAFVELDDNLEGLCHISELSEDMLTSRRYCTVGPGDGFQDSSYRSRNEENWSVGSRCRKR
jgi:small subunit ribosomal protein S1